MFNRLRKSARVVNAVSHTHSIKDWPRNAVATTIGAVLLFGTKWALGWTWDSVVDEVVTAILALVLGFIVIPAVEFSYHYARAPRRMAEDDNTQLRKERDEARAQRDLITQQFNNRTKELTEQATGFLSAGIYLRQHAPRENPQAAPDTIKAWETELHQWANDTTSFLNSCSGAAALKFLDISSVRPHERYTNIHSDVQKYYGVLRRRIESLTDIIEKRDVYFG